VAITDWLEECLANFSETGLHQCAMKRKRAKPLWALGGFGRCALTKLGDAL